MAEFNDNQSVRVGDETYSADNILIAVGGTPRPLGVPGEVSTFLIAD
jgi:pyruvate/2-oxoglutarate dehydrogenase complex dihydrolipoamide dehydrogenase (E3) component